MENFYIVSMRISLLFSSGEILHCVNGNSVRILQLVSQHYKLMLHNTLAEFLLHLIDKNVIQMIC